jgi:23S rRNA (cytidine1920-2'-O)/16S rRNA (cytidine1409-2'-O)-methyltransferase
MLKRIDRALVERKLAESRTQARSFIAQGKVTVNGFPVSKPSRLVASSDQIGIEGDSVWYPRGYYKLKSALDYFAISPSGLCLDVGSSTGGFVMALLEYGARKVVAVDVGTGQLDERLRRDPRVVSMEQTDVRSFRFDGAPDLVTVDISFISQSRVSGSIAGLLGNGLLLSLVKPQFELDAATAGRNKGVIHSTAERQRSLSRVVAAYRDLGLSLRGVCPSGLKGTKGNQEYFLLFSRQKPDKTS